MLCQCRTERLAAVDPLTEAEQAGLSQFALDQVKIRW
jgi:hypothetical protein